MGTTGKCFQCVTGISNLVLIDTDKERDIDLGVNYTYSKLAKDECIIHQTLAQRLFVLEKSEFNTTIYINLNLEVFMKDFLIETYYMNKTHPYNPNIENIKEKKHYDIYDFSIPCKVKYIIDQNYGKVDQDNHMLVLMEKEFFFKTLAENLELRSSFLSKFEDIKEVMNNINPDQYSNELIINFEKPRTDSYLTSNFQDLQFKGVSYANKIIENLGGSDHLSVNLPSINKMEPLFYGAIFLGLILDVIIIILFILSLILIHSLLTITTETSSFEIGILRLIGTTKLGVIKLIILQCFSFSIPAFFLAYIIHFPLLSMISIVLSDITGSTLNLKHSIYSLIFSILICNIAPLIASIFPIINLLKRDLAWSLNTTKSKTTGIKIEIISASENERNTLIIFGILTSFFGISIYYFLPLSLLSLNLEILLGIFLFILLGMLLGLILLTLNMEFIFQKFITYTLFLWTKSHIKIIILKNLSAHRIRNRLTSIMYSLSIGFFIMILVGADIILKSLELETLSRKGSYVHLQNVNRFYIDPEDIYSSLQKMKEKNLIDTFSFVGANLRDACKQSHFVIMNYGKSMDIDIDVFSVSPNYIESSVQDFLMIGEETSIDMTLGERLYLAENSGRIGMSSYFTWDIDLHLDDLFFLKGKYNDMIIPFLFKSAFLVRSSPAFAMSSEPSMKYDRDVLVPFNTYLDIINKCWRFLPNDATQAELIAYSYSDFPIYRVLLKLNSHIDLNYALKEIGDIINSDPKYFVNYWKVYDKRKSLNLISNIINYIFLGVSGIVLIFCFFNLTASMTINIFQQNKEISIYRALGMTSFNILFIYIYEAFILVFCSSLIGVIVGSILSWTMTLQRIIFTNLPLTFKLPYYQLSLILCFSLIGAILSTIFPAKSLLKKQISDLIRDK
jgi:ABC-type antimicrobial peptide transport system permease subunit